jgi:putative flavoprotein involved in K+ transport
MEATMGRIETVIVGGGQAGLALSYWLSQLGREHIILERARLAERWRSERWDSLAFQFPNWALSLPGYAYRASNPDGFAPRQKVVRFLEDYASHIDAPIRLGVTATALRPHDDGIYRLSLETDHGRWQARNVVLATGPFQKPSVPSYSAALPEGVAQLHSRDYRNPGRLPPGAVLVVGGGTSGAEIAHELNQSGRAVYLSIGTYRKAPRRYRGRDIFWWIQELELWDRPLEPHTPGRLEGVPLLTGLNGGSDLDLRRLSDEGVTLLGRAHGFCDGKVILGSDLEESLLHGDAWCARLKQMIDDYAEFTGLNVLDEAGTEGQQRRRTTHAQILALDLQSAGITSIIWATGYRYDFHWVQQPVFTDVGAPIQKRGVTSSPGLYFLGLRRMHTLKSAILSASGVGADAAHVADQIAADRGVRRRPRAPAKLESAVPSRRLVSA